MSDCSQIFLRILEVFFLLVALVVALAAISTRLAFTVICSARAIEALGDTPSTTTTTTSPQRRQSGSSSALDTHLVGSKRKLENRACGDHPSMAGTKPAVSYRVPQEQEWALPPFVLSQGV